METEEDGRDRAEELDNEPYTDDENYWKWVNLQCGMWFKVPRYRGDGQRFWQQTQIRYDNIADFDYVFGGLIVVVRLKDGTDKRLNPMQAMKFLSAMQDYLGISNGAT